MSREEELNQFLQQEEHEAAVRGWRRAVRALDLEERRFRAQGDPMKLEKIEDSAYEPIRPIEPKEEVGPKVKLNVIADYRNRKIHYKAGQVIEVGQELAAWLMNDASGCFEIV